MQRFETLGKRFGAALLDWLIMFVVSSILYVLLSMTGAPPLLIAGLTGLSATFYYIFMHYYRGQTFGKWALSVKVLDDSEESVAFGQAILRSLPQLIPVMFAISFSTAGETREDEVFLWYSLINGSVILFSLADALVCLANEKHRALHDFIAGTIVIRTDI